MAELLIPTRENRPRAVNRPNAQRCGERAMRFFDLKGVAKGSTSTGCEEEPSLPPAPRASRDDAEHSGQPQPCWRRHRVGGMARGVAGGVAGAARAAATASAASAASAAASLAAAAAMGPASPSGSTSAGRGVVGGGVRGGVKDDTGDLVGGGGGTASGSSGEARAEREMASPPVHTAGGEGEPSRCWCGRPCVPRSSAAATRRAAFCSAAEIRASASSRKACT